MGRLPSVNTGNEDLDYYLRSIDEALSELYSQHGKQTARSSTEAETLKLTGNLKDGNPAAVGTIYADMQIVAIGKVTSDGYFLGNARNLQPTSGMHTSSKTATGAYSYTVISGARPSNVAVFVSTQSVSATSAINYQWTAPGIITVSTYDAGVATDNPHSIMVVGSVYTGIV